MPFTDLDQLISVESDRVEWKSSLSQGAKIRQTICAFANDLPGHSQPSFLIIGLTNDRKNAGPPIDDQLLNELSNLPYEGRILPYPSLVIQKHVYDGGEIAVVAVHPSSSPPVRYNGVIWVRVGPTLRIASAADEQRFVERTVAATHNMGSPSMPRNRHKRSCRRPVSQRVFAIGHIR